MFNSFVDQQLNILFAILMTHLRKQADIGKKTEEDKK
jgi:hypothetical protein